LLQHQQPLRTRLLVGRTLRTLGVARSACEDYVAAVSQHTTGTSDPQTHNHTTTPKSTSKPRTPVVSVHSGRVVTVFSCSGCFHSVTPFARQVHTYIQ